MRCPATTRRSRRIARLAHGRVAQRAAHLPALRGKADGLVTVRKREGVERQAAFLRFYADGVHRGRQLTLVERLGLRPLQRVNDDPLRAICAGIAINHAPIRKPHRILNRMQHERVDVVGHKRFGPRIIRVRKDLAGLSPGHTYQATCDRD